MAKQVKQYPLDLSAYPVHVYSDAGVIPEPGVRFNNKSPIGSTWAYVHVAEDGQTICREGRGGVVLNGMPNHFGFAVCQTPIPFMECNLAELVSAIMALKCLPEGWSGTFYCDNANAIGRIFGIRGKLYAMNGVPPILVRKATEIRERLGKVERVLLEGHPSQKKLRDGTGIGKDGLPISEFNVLCDERCKAVRLAYLEMYNKANAKAAPK